MAVKSSGPISLTDIVGEFGGATPHSMSEYYRGGAYVPNGPTQNANIATSGAISMGGFYGAVKQVTINLTIAATTTNYNLRTALVNAGWDQVTPVAATVTINSGVIVGSTSTGAYAFDTGASFPAGSSLSLVNNGQILGRGGNGGNGGTFNANGVAGGAGGPALRAQAAIKITNNGVIGGGGGGGGGGGAIYGNSSTAGGSGGGGGRGYNGGAGGGAPSSSGSTGNPGGAGSQTAAGGGGASTNWNTGGKSPMTYTGGAGGNGGGLGASGAAGGQAMPTSGGTHWAPGSGGAGGACTTGNGNITWLATGSRYGALG